MKIILCVRDLKWGIGRHVIKFIQILERQPEVEKILLITSATPDFFGDKVEIRTVHLKGGTFITKEPHFAWLCTSIIKKTLKREHYDIIDLRQPALLSSLKKFSAAIVYNVHVTHFQFSRQAPRGWRYLPVKLAHRIFEWFEYWQFKWAHMVCFVSRRTQREFIRLYPGLAVKTEYIANFRDMDLFFQLPNNERLEKRQKLGLSEEEFALLYCGRLDRMKNIDALLDAFRKTRQKIPNISLLVAGNGTMQDPVSREPGVVYLGQLEPARLNDVYNAADCTILPSLYENFPGVVLESIAAGTPIISTDVGDIMDWLPQELVIRGFDADSLSRSIETVFHMNHDQLERHVRQLQKQISAHHDAAANTLGKLALYHELVNHRSIIYFSIREFPSRMASSVHIMKMCQALQKTGNRVTLVASINDDPENIFHHYGIQKAFSIHRSWTPSTRFKPLRMIGWLYFLVNAVRFARRQKPDLIYVRDLFSGVWFDRLNIPFIYECHEDPLHDIKKLFLKRMLKSRNLKLVVTISRSLHEIIETKYGKQLGDRPVMVAHDGVDLSVYPTGRTAGQLRRELGLPQNEVLAGYSGSLYRGRGIDIILSTAGMNPRIRFVIIGGSPQEVRSLIKEAESRRIDNLIVTGHVPHHAIPHYLSAMDLLLMPYQRKVTLQGNKRDTARYMSPLKMFEYMAAGVPIISSDLPVLREILHHQKNALLVEPSDARQWHEAISRILEDGNLALSLAQNAKRDVRLYEWDQRAQAIVGRLEAQRQEMGE